MPAPPIELGVEFAWHRVSNGDGGTLALFATVVDEAGDFTVRSEQSGPSGGTLCVRHPDGTKVLPIAPGSRVLVRSEESAALGGPFSVVRDRVELQGGFAARGTRTGQRRTTLPKGT